MNNEEYQQVIENFYEKVVITNYNRLKKGITDSLAEGLGVPMPMEVHVEAANTLNAICSYYDVLLKGKVDYSSWFLACSFANNRLKHDRRTAGMIRKQGGFSFPNREPYFAPPFRPEIKMLICAPFFVSLVPDVNWVLIGDIQPEPNTKEFLRKLFEKQKAAYREHFEGKSVVNTLRTVLGELGVELND